MINHADLEISLHPTSATNYRVELRFTDPQSGSDSRQSGAAQFDRDSLHQMLLDPTAYGHALTDALFADPCIRERFAIARGLAGSRPLRLRLTISNEVPKLHGLRWETLRDPTSGDMLLTSEHVLFSRYLSSSTWRPIELRPRTHIRALAVVANPTNLADYAPTGTALAPIDVAGELARVCASLGDIPITEVAANGNATMTTITAHLRDGYDILYLVAHGAMIKEMPHLWLEKRDRTADVVAGESLTTHLGELQHPPQLVVLASCESAGSGEGDALAALGPRLAEAGIPAVLAMQGNICMETVAAFMPVFFREVQRDGQVDRAVAVARGSIRQRHDWWMPLLFLRLRDGQVWDEADEHALQASLEHTMLAYQTHVQESLLCDSVVTQPYQSLYAYTIEDTARFFGRRTAIAQVAERVLAHRLTVVHARSGAGKTSLLNAGLLPHLLRKRALPLVVRTLGQPLYAVKHTLATYAPAGAPLLAESLSLHRLLHILCRSLTRMHELVLIFDQFEEFFTMRDDTAQEQASSFIADLARCCADSTLPVRIVLSIRGDYLTDLADFEPHLPHIFHQQYRLEPMNRTEAQEAIEAPLRLLHPPVTYDPVLLERLLDDLERSGMELPHLQILCTALYAGLPTGAPTITLAQYQQQGEAARLLGDYLRREVEHLGDHAPLARTVLAELVSHSGTRQARSLDDLQHALIQRSDLHQLAAVLARLVTARLVQRDEREGTAWYELAHDYLIGEIRAWVTPEDLAARRARELVQQGVANWHSHGWLLDADPLAFIYAQRESLSNLIHDEVDLLLRSAVHHQAAVDTWAQVAHQYGSNIQPILQPLLMASDHRTRAHVITVLRVLGETALPLLQAALADPAPLVRVHAIRALEYLATVAARHTLQHELVYEVAIPATDGQPRFYIDRYPVRNGDYQMFLADQPAYPPPPAWIARTVARDRETHPVTGITWDDAQAYATWAGKRLPTAAEWVQAAGGEHQPYPWGNTFHPDRSNTCEAHLGTTTPVDRYAPASNSVYGVADMAGNVWEWLADPAGPDGSYRQLRGGGWMYSATFARIDFDRCWRRPDQRQDAIGFRLCFDATREENDQ